jgi:hypothetical protein
MMGGSRAGHRRPKEACRHREAPPSPPTPRHQDRAHAPRAAPPARARTPSPARVPPAGRSRGARAAPRRAQWRDDAPRDRSGRLRDATDLARQSHPHLPAEGRAAATPWWRPGRIPRPGSRAGGAAVRA